MLTKLTDPIAAGLSRLLRAYYDRRMQSRFAGDPDFDGAVGLKEFTLDERGVIAVFERGSLAPLAIDMAEVFDAGGGTNYVSLAAWHPTRGKFEIIVRPLSGKLPATRVSELTTLAILGVRLARDAWQGRDAEDREALLLQLAGRALIYTQFAQRVLTEAELRNVGLPAVREGDPAGAGESQGV